GQQIRSADIEKRARKESEHPGQHSTERHKQSRASAQHRRDHVEHEPEHGAPHRIPVREDDRTGVEAVTEIVRDYSQRVQQAQLTAALKARSYRNAVQKTVESQACRRQGAEFLLVGSQRVLMFPRSMHGRVALEAEKCQESESCQWHV